jgi:hypothetical protein
MLVLEFTAGFFVSYASAFFFCVRLTGFSSVDASDVNLLGDSLSSNRFNTIQVCKATVSEVNLEIKEEEGLRDFLEKKKNGFRSKTWRVVRITSIYPK